MTLIMHHSPPVDDLLFRNDCIDPRRHRTRFDSSNGEGGVDDGEEARFEDIVDSFSDIFH